jgi:hypothetical protein
MQYVQFAIDHHNEILAILGAAYALLSAFVAVTPSTADDAALMRVAQRISFLTPRNIPGRFSLPGKMPRDTSDSIGPMIVVLLCLLPLSGCAGSGVRRHVHAIEAIDAATHADALAYEARVRAETIEAVQAECPTAPNWDACIEEQAQAVVERFERWEASHNAAVAGRDTYLLAVRSSEADSPSRARVMMQALDLVVRLAEVAETFGVTIPIDKLVQMVTR